MSEIKDVVDEPAIEEVVPPERGFTSAAVLSRVQLPRTEKTEPIRSANTSLHSLGTIFARTFEAKDFKSFSNAQYDVLTTLLYRRKIADRSEFLSKSDFFKGIAYAIQMRLFAINTDAVTGEYSKAAITFSDEFQVPKPIGKLINNVGRVSLNAGTMHFIPYPDTSSAAAKIKTDYEEIEVEFLNFIDLMRTHGSIPLESISDKPEGTKYWLLDTVEGEDIQKEATLKTRHLIIRSMFADVTDLDMQDAAYAAFGIRNAAFYEALQLGATVQIPTYTPNLWAYSVTLQNIVKDRNSFLNMTSGK